MINRSIYDAPKDKFINNKNINSQGNRNYNPFSPLVDLNIERYNNNNFGHKSYGCRNLIRDHLINNENKGPPKTWKENEKRNTSKNVIWFYRLIRKEVSRTLTVFVQII